MSTIIDELIVQIGLDATGFKAGQAQTTASLKSLGDGATRTGADVQKVAQGMANSFARVRTEILGVLGLFAVSRGLSGLTSEITGQDAALGRLSSRLGMSAQELAAWDGAGQSAGARAGELTGSITTMSAAFERFKLTGQGGDTFIPYLTRLGIHLRNADGSMKSFNEQQLEYARAFQAQDRIDPKATDFLAGQLPGMTQGSIDFYRHGQEYVQARLDKQKAIGLPTQQDTRNAQDILEQLGYVDGRMRTFGRHLLNDVSPGITCVLTRLGDWLDHHLPGWYAKIDRVIQGFMKRLDGLDFDRVATDVEHFGTRVYDVFHALTSWVLLAWMARLLGVGSGDGGAGAPSQPGTSAGADRGGLPGFFSRNIGAGVGGQKAIDYFVAQGWTPEQAAGIAGNLQQESGFRPDAGVKEQSSHRGIAQWDPSRRADIEKQFGVSVDQMNYDQQLQAVQWELTQNAKTKAAGDKLQRETTVAASSSSVAHNYEVPVSSDDPDAETKWAAEEGRRRHYAEQQFRDYPGTGKRALDHPGGFWDGLRNPPPDVPRGIVPYVAPPLPEWRPVQPIPLLPEDGRDYPGDGVPEKPDYAGAKRFLSGGQPAPPPPSAPMPPVGAGAFLVHDAQRRWAQEHRGVEHHDHSSVTNIHGPINVHTKATDAKGIARDMHHALKARGMAAQANRG